MLTKADGGGRGGKPNADHCWRRGEGGVQESLILADVICEQPLNVHHNDENAFEYPWFGTEYSVELFFGDYMQPLIKK